MSASLLPKRVLAGLLDELPDPVFVLDRGGVLRYANRACGVAIGRDPADHLGTSVLHLVHPEDLPAVLATLEHAGDGTGCPLVDVRLASADGRWRRWEIHGAGRFDNAVGGAVLVARDTTDRPAEPLPERDAQSLRTVVEHAPALLVLLDGAASIVRANAAVRRLLGRDPDALVGTRLSDLVEDADRRRVSTALRAVRRTGQAQVVDASLRHVVTGRTVPFELALSCLDGDPASWVVLSGHVATSLHEARARIDHLVDRDPLTGLANRGLLLRQLGRVLRDPRPSGDCVVVCIGLDRFGAFNDLYGQDVGDRLLVRFVDRLRRAGRHAEVVARTAGVEFVAVFDGLADHAAIEQLMRSIEDVMDEPFTIDSLTTRMSFTVGSVVANREATPERVVAEAIAAMAALKAAKRGTVTPEPPVLDLTVRRGLADQLSTALHDEQIRTHFQPIHRLPGREVVALEALVRWHHPVRGVLQPGEFLPVIEQAGLSAQLGGAVLHQACRLLLARDDDPVVVHVNTSAGELHDPRFAAGALATVSRLGVPPDQICFELGAHEVVRRQWHGTNDVVVENLRELRAAGFHLAFDNFGTGSSSLSDLLELPVDTIKIDQRFVGPVAHDRACAAVVSSVVRMGADLGCTTIAEGVETADQLVQLHNLGCPYVQGFLLSRPAEIGV
jgi:diguanylate cyclase (GGDEF)-like protein/PAS domain S-box-containing protein